MPEERKLVTVLFADIVGSTALGEAEDPELVRRTLGRAFTHIREQLEAHGGTVEKFIGDAVMAVFGVPTVHDDDADRAVRAAFALRSSVAELSRSLPFPLKLRIGINSGQVVAGIEGADTLVTGGPVNAAARIQQSAGPGEIVVGPLTRQLTEGGVRYAPPRAVEAKGLGTIEVSLADSLIAAVPEQRRGLGALRAPLIGRDAELRLLRETFRKASEERAASLVTVYGQAGVGKSRLVAEFVEVIGRERVLRGRCLPYGTGITYWPLQEMLRADAEIRADDTRDEATRKLRARVLAAFGDTPDQRDTPDDAEAVARRIAVVAGLADPTTALPGTEPAALGQELRWGVRRYFERRADREPLALVFDDIHWAEEPLLELIEHLAEWSRAPLFVLCLTRPDLRDRRPAWGGGLMNATAVRLEPLSAEETRRLMAALLAIDDLPEVVRDTIVARAQGNPLYVEELLRMLIDAGNIERREGRFVATRTIGDVPVPATLQGLLAARLDQLPAPAKRALQRAAVIGQVFYPDALAALGPLEGSALDLLVVAARRDFVSERDERGPGGGRAWQFKHILIRDVAYDSLPKEERSRLHDAFGRWLESVSGERRDEYTELVAYHADQAYGLARELRDERAGALGRRALDLVLPAARRARRGGAFRAERELYRRAAEIADAIGASAAERAEARGSALLARAQVEGGRSIRDEFPAALALARDAGSSEILTRLLSREAVWVSDGEPERAEAIGQEAVAVARDTGDADLLAEALIGQSWLPWYRGELDEHLRILGEVDAHIRATGARRHLPDYLFALRANAMERGDFDAFLKALSARLEAAKAHESKFIRARAPEDVANQRALVAGEHDAWIDAARRLITVHEEFGVDASRLKQNLGSALHAAGRYAEAVTVLREAVRMAEATATGGFSGEARQLLARAELAAGDLAPARRSAELANREIDARDAYSRSTTATALAMVRAAEGDLAEADRLHREAVAVNERTGYQRVATEARQSYAEFLLAHGRAAEARPLLERVRDFYAHPFVVKRRARAEELLRQCDEVAAR